MNILRRLLFSAILIAGGSLTAFAQKDEPKPPKGKPPIIVVKPKEGEKPKDDKPKDGKKPQGETFGVFSLVKIGDD